MAAWATIASISAPASANSSPALCEESVAILPRAVGHQCHQFVNLVRFATKAKNKHPCRIWVRRQSGQNRTRSAQIIAQLRTAMGVREGVNAIDLARCNLVGMTQTGFARDLFSGQADASDRRQDPDFVACRRAAIGAKITSPGGVMRADRRHIGIIIGRIGQFARQRRRQIMGVNVVANGDRGCGLADGLAILTNMSPMARVISASLCPCGTAARAVKLCSPSATSSPAAIGRSATATLSSGCTRIRAGCRLIILPGGLALQISLWGFAFAWECRLW
jgi:hypothetical protein